MKTTNFLGLLLFAGVFFSCSKIESGNDDIFPDETGLTSVFNLVATMDAVTKTALDDENYITWKSGDAISVWEAGNTSNTNVKLTLDAASEGQRKGFFCGNLVPSGSSFKLYAIYPYSSEYASSPSSVSVNVPTAVNQCSTVNEVVGISDFLVGSADLSSSDESYKMLFRHPLTLLDIVIDGSNSVLCESTIASLTITANTPFVGDAIIDLTTGALTPSTGDSGKNLTITFPSTAKMNVEQHAWVAVLPSDLSAASCCFDLKMTNGQEIRFNVNPKKAFEAQNIYTVKLTDIDAKVDAGKATPVYLDLVSKGGGLRANCYVIHEGGYYRFAAQRVDKSNCFEGSKPYTDGYRADWLWATGTKSKVDFVGIGNSGSINFRVAAKANGNTVIALYNPSKEIVWSWHVWCTTEDMLNPTHYSRNNSWLMSDANIGATSKENGNVDSYGLYYQWGRKDPFPADAKNCVMNESVSFSGLTSKDSKVSADALAYTISHPTTYLYENDYHTWISDATNAVNAQSLWNKTTDRNKKTIYDPCPQGYAVPIHNDYAWYTTFVASNMEWKSNGVIYTEPNTHVSSFYPAAGYLNGMTLTDAGSTVRLWSASLDGTPSATANIHGNSLLMTLSTNGIQRSSARSAFAFPVRCMKQ